MLHIKRIYDTAEKSDGYRILVDRMWPRGVAKADAAIDEWCKDVAPSSDLRTWFGHDPKKFSEFKRRYCAELEKNPATQELVKVIQAHKTTTLLYGAKDETHNQAVVLLDYCSEIL